MDAWFSKVLLLLIIASLSVKGQDSGFHVSLLNQEHLAPGLAEVTPESAPSARAPDVASQTPPAEESRSRGILTEAGANLERVSADLSERLLKNILPSIQADPSRAKPQSRGLFTSLVKKIRDFHGPRTEQTSVKEANPNQDQPQSRGVLYESGAALIRLKHLGRDLVAKPTPPKQSVEGHTLSAEEPQSRMYIYSAIVKRLNDIRYSRNEQIQPKPDETGPAQPQSRGVFSSLVRKFKDTLATPRSQQPQAKQVEPDLARPESRTFLLGALVQKLKDDLALPRSQQPHEKQAEHDLAQPESRGLIKGFLVQRQLKSPTPKTEKPQVKPSEPGLAQPESRGILFGAVTQKLKDYLATARSQQPQAKHAEQGLTQLESRGLIKGFLVQYLKNLAAPKTEKSQVKPAEPGQVQPQSRGLMKVFLLKLTNFGSPKTERPQVKQSEPGQAVKPVQPTLAVPSGVSSSSHVKNTDKDSPAQPISAEPSQAKPSSLESGPNENQ